MRKVSNANVSPTVKLSFEISRQDHAKLMWLACSRGVLSSELAASFIRSGLRIAGVSCTERSNEKSPVGQEDLGAL
jgi:hypothetical protein